MKQKLLYTVLLMTAVYLPASSKECGKVIKLTVIKSIQETNANVANEVEEVAAFPASPASRMIFQL